MTHLQRREVIIGLATVAAVPAILGRTTRVLCSTLDEDQFPAWVADDKHAVGLFVNQGRWDAAIRPDCQK
jgi:hypothetical protein